MGHASIFWVLWKGGGDLTYVQCDCRLAYLPKTRTFSTAICAELYRTSRQFDQRVRSQPHGRGYT